MCFGDLGWVGLGFFSYSISATDQQDPIQRKIQEQVIWEQFKVELMERFSYIEKMYLFGSKMKNGENAFEIQNSRRNF